jgi:hypothetical protein
MTRKYRLNLKRALLIGFVTAAGFSGCKKYLNVNQNPNNPSTVDPTLLLPTTEAALSQVVGNAFQVPGNMWAQYWTQSPVASQYKSFDQYSPTATTFDNPWSNLYSVAIENADLIIQNPASSANLQGIAYVIKAYGFQLAADAFGNIPLSQALQPTVYTSPKFDAQQAVYDSIFVYINRALPLLNAAPPATPLGATQDMIFQGDMSQWIAFTNTLELRAYLRLSKVASSTAQAGITALYATNPTFLTEDATITYTATGGNQNPFYNEAVALGYTQNVGASSTIVTAFTRNNDPRLGKFFVLLSNTPPSDSIQSIPQGSYLLYPGKHLCPPSALVGGNVYDPNSAYAPVKLLSASESDFLQAEAVSRNWTGGKGGSAQTLFVAGITASFAATGAGDPTTYISTAPDGMAAFTTNQIQAIITQKYYAMCGFQGFEAWTEWRRTGYPTFFVQSAASLLTPGQMPERMLYPNTELVSNLNYPGTVPIYTPVWWGM